MIMDSIRRKFKKVWGKRKQHAAVKSHLKTYQRYVKNFANMETSLLQDYYEENFFKFFALLLQVVSFFTTYAGVAMYFGNIFDLAPLFIAVTIQGVLYMTAISAFKPGKKNHRRKMAMFMCTLVSVAFSYTGLVTLANSPATDYKRAYESYENTFAALKNEVKQKNQEVDSLAADISNEYLKTIGTLQALDRRISQLEELAGQKITVPQTNTSTQTTTLPDGTVVRGSSKTANPEYNDAVNARNQAAGEAMELKMLRDDLYNEIVDAVGAGAYGAGDGQAADAGQTADNGQTGDQGQGAGGGQTSEQGQTSDQGQADPQETRSYSGIRAAVEWERLAEKLNAFMDASVDSSQAIQNFRQEYFRVANKNNSALDKAVSQDNTEFYRMNENLLETGLEQLMVYKNISSLELVTWDAIAQEQLAQERTGISRLVANLGNAIGADMYNMDMEQLMSTYKNLKDAAVDNYNRVSALLPEPGQYEQYAALTQQKEQVLALPEVLTIAFKRLTDHEYQSSALVCLILALLNDFSTVLLGWLGTKKAYSFLYVKSGKTKYDDVDELFGLVFQSLQSQFVLGIRTGQFTQMTKEEFEQECLTYINRIINEIRGFLAQFTLSPCTSSMGYNLVWKYKDQVQIQAYIPVISVLMKANLLKVLPVSQYEYLEMEYYLGKKGHMWIEELEDGSPKDVVEQELGNVKELGHILLLRNKGENYLRENLTSTVILEGTDKMEAGAAGCAELPEYTAAAAEKEENDE